MNVQDQTTQKDDAQKAWAQLDAEDAGTAQRPIPGNDQQDAADFATTDPAPADQADAPREATAETASEQTLLDKVAGLEGMLTQVTQRLRNAEGHIGGLNNQLKQGLQAAQQVASQGGEAPTAVQLRTAQGDPEAMKSLKRDYPEFASAMESALDERLSALEQRAPTPAPVQQPAGVSSEDMQRMRNDFQVEVRHPGWQERVQTPEFAGWLNRQPREVQLLAASASPQDAVRLLDIHNETTKASTTQRNQRLNAAAAIPSGRSGANVRQKAFEEMTPQEQWHYLDQVDKSKG